MAKVSFEENLQNLENVVSTLEKGNISLDDSLKLFEKGMKFSRECMKELDKVEAKVKLLVKNEANGYQLELLD